MAGRLRALLLLSAVALAAPRPTHAEVPDVRLFFDAAASDEKTAEAALARIEAAGWRDSYAALVVDLARFLPQPRAGEPGDTRPLGLDDEPDRTGGVAGTGALPESGRSAPAGPRAKARERLVRFLEARTGQRFGQDLKRWRRWIWERPDEPHPHYVSFKATLYAGVDPRFAAFFPAGVRSLVRLDEIDWGGVVPDGIPPLDHPKTLTAADARYLGDKDVVFGVYLNGEARAYPKRILGWHELARDSVGGMELAIVYCPLCGTAIPYGSEQSGKRLTFGTSGLLYRSNKLMYDAETLSLWSAVEGRPVVGPLAGSGIELRAHPVVTTSWREWRAAHPDTSVLSLDTGHQRDYSEGAAYREYFSNDRLMFAVPGDDERLKNKAEVLALLLRPAGAAAAAPRRALALSVEFLRRNPVHQRSFAGRDLVVITTAEGANRVYDTGGARFARIEQGGRLIDERGLAWQVTEQALLPDGRDEPQKLRVPARRAFWFGWRAQFPDTELVVK